MEADLTLPRVVPISRLDDEEDTGREANNLQRLVVVDARYHRQIAPASDFQIDAASTEVSWAGCFAMIGSALGVAIDVDNLDPASLYPDVSRNASGESAAVLLDALARNVGKRDVRKHDGRVQVQGFLTAWQVRQQDDANHPERRLRGCGDLFRLGSWRPPDEGRRPPSGRAGLALMLSGGCRRDRMRAIPVCLSVGWTNNLVRDILTWVGFSWLRSCAMSCMRQRPACSPHRSRMAIRPARSAAGAGGFAAMGRSMPNQTIRPRNRFLDRLPGPSLELLRPHLQEVELAYELVLYEDRGPIDWAYFPTGAILSALTVMLDGTAIEVATVGIEGLVGHYGFGAMTSPHRMIVQVGGWGLRIASRALHELAAKDGPLGQLLNAYHVAFMAQVSQSVACNGLHRLEQRCSRWLLMSRDRIDSDDIRLTHEYLAIMLGSRRASVTEALRPLQDEGLIRSHRGVISILDGEGLEARSCECYAVVRDRYRELLGG